MILNLCICCQLAVRKSFLFQDVLEFNGKLSMHERNMKGLDKVDSSIETCCVYIAGYRVFNRT